MFSQRSESLLQAYALRPEAETNRPEALFTELAALDSVLLFVARDQHGRELWQSNGTPEGTSLLKDIQEGEKSSDPRNLIRFKHMIFFSADDAHGHGIWQLDPSTKGTVMVRDIYPGFSGSIANRFEDMAICKVNHLLFSASDGLHGIELWESDGTSRGTHMVQDLVPGPSSSNPEDFTIAGEYIFFKTTDSVHGKLLWALKY